MTPRQPTGNPPGRRPAEDPTTVRRNVRSARFTDAEAEAIDATPGGLRAIVVERLTGAQASMGTTSPSTEP